MGVPHGLPPYFWWAHPHALAIVYFWFFSCSGDHLVWCNKGIKPPFCWWQGSLFSWVGVLCISEEDASSSILLTWRGTYPLHPPLFGLANHDPVLWVVVSAMGFTIWWHLWAMMSFPRPNVHVPSNVYAYCMLPGVFTLLQWMLQQMSTVEIITSC